jgi:O-antigen/teichoic acid export membrane protein
MLHEHTANSSVELIRRRLLSGGTWALSGRVALVFTGLATNALLARLLTPAELGAYFLAFSMVGILASLGALGLKHAVVRFVAESVGLRQYERARRSIKIALVYGSLGAVAVSLTYLFFGGRLASSLFNSPALAAVAGVTSGWILISALQALLVETFRGFHDIRITITLGGVADGNGVLTGGVLSLSLLVLFLFRGEAGLAVVMLLGIVSGGVSTLLAALLLRRRVVSLPQSSSDEKLWVGEMMNVAVPLMVTNLSIFALGQASIWVVGALLGPQEVALYGAAFRLMRYVAVPLQIANMVAPPLIAELYAQGRIEQLQRTVRAVATTAAIPAILPLAAFILFGGPIMGLIFGGYYREASVPLALLSLGQIVSVWAGSCEQALMMTGHQTTMMAIVVITGLFMVLGGIWAAQHYGIAGVAGVVAGGLVLRNIVTLLIVRRKVGVWTHAGLSELLSMTRSGR